MTGRRRVGWKDKQTRTARGEEGHGDGRGLRRSPSGEHRPFPGRRRALPGGSARHRAGPGATQPAVTRDTPAATGGHCPGPLRRGARRHRQARPGDTHSTGQQAQRARHGDSQQPRSVGREVAVPGGAAPCARAPLRTGQWPERLHGHRQSRAGSGTRSHARAPLGDTRGTGQWSSGAGAAQGCPRPRGDELTPGRVAQHGVPTPRPRSSGLQPRVPGTGGGSGLAPRALAGARAPHPRHCRGPGHAGNPAGRGRGGAARRLHVGGRAVAAHALRARSGPFPERLRVRGAVPSRAELSSSSIPTHTASRRPVLALVSASRVTRARLAPHQPTALSLTQLYSR